MQSPTPPAVTYLPWGLWGLARVLLALALAGVVAYLVMAPGVLPADVLAPLSLLVAGYGDPPWRIIQVIALLAVVAGLAAVIVRRPGDSGLLAAALTIGFLAQARAGAAYLLIAAGSGKVSVSPADTYAQMAAEAAIWGLLLCGIWLVGRYVETRFFNLDSSRPTADLAAGHEVAASPAICWVKEPSAGLKGAIITLLISAAAIYALCQTLAPGQVVFAVWFSLFIATLAAHRLAGFRMAFWPLVALTVLMTGGYLLASWQPHPPQPFDLLTVLPPNRWAYPTPAQYAAFGGLGVVTGIWFSQRLHRLEAMEKHAAGAAL